MVDKTPAEPDQTTKLFELLHQFVLNSYNRFNEPRQNGFGETISAADIVALDLVERFPGIIVSDLASRLERSIGTVSLRVATLGLSGYLEKTKEDGNDRVVHLYCTTKARELVEDFRESDRLKSVRIRNQISQHCSEQEVASFTKVLCVLQYLLERGELSL